MSNSFRSSERAHAFAEKYRRDPDRDCPPGHAHGVAKELPGGCVKRYLLRTAGGPFHRGAAGGSETVHRRISLVLLFVPLVVASGFTTDSTAAQPVRSPIRHIVVIYMENHSFNDVLGTVCVEEQRAVGATTAPTSRGTQNRAA